MVMVEGTGVKGVVASALAKEGVVVGLEQEGVGAVGVVGDDG